MFKIEKESSEYEKSLTEDGKRYLNYVENLAKAKGIKIETELRKGSVWSEVIAYADDSKSDLILLGEHKHIQSKDVISSIYREIISHANCSVLVVKEKDIEKLYKMA